LYNYSDIISLERAKADTHSFRLEDVAGITKDQTTAYLRPDLFFPRSVVSPHRILIPAIGKQAPIIHTNIDVDSALDRGVVLYDFSGTKKSKIIFGHSSATVESPYRYIFTKITKLKKGSEIALETESELYRYKIIGSKIISPSEVSELEDAEGRLYLVTCYPFLSTLSRYVVEAQLEAIETKKYPVQ
jgi:LPXTG-site transpeptidase (sortase) family protein